MDPHYAYVTVQGGFLDSYTGLLAKRANLDRVDFKPVLKFNEVRLPCA